MATNACTSPCAQTSCTNMDTRAHVMHTKALLCWPFPWVQSVAWAAGGDRGKGAASPAGWCSALPSWSSLMSVMEKMNFCNILRNYKAEAQHTTAFRCHVCGWHTHNFVVSTENQVQYNQCFDPRSDQEKCSVAYSSKINHNFVNICFKNMNDASY